MIRSLYIHIPFCASKCRYCDFYSVPFSEGAGETYVRALCRELVMRKTDAGPLESVYIGGGTPTVLPITGISEIMASVFQNYEIVPDAEVTVEANPGTLTGGRMECLRNAGVNRLSIGIQSLRDPDLQVLGRTHSARTARESVRTARNAGFRSLSVDLMYGLPGQTPESWGGVLEETLDLGADHLSAYELTLEKGTPLHAAVEGGELTMPHEESVATMYFRTADLAGVHGFRQYEISNYSLSGHECRHNLNCWERGEYLGIGAGAHSFAGGVRSANVCDIRQYATRIGQNMLPVAESQRIGEVEALAEAVFLGLRTAGGVDLRRLPEEARRAMNKAVEDFVSHGLAELSENRLRLTRRGLVLSNEVIARLLPLLEPSTSRRPRS